MNRSAILAASVFALSACTFAIVGEDNFRREAFQRSATFDVNYQRLYRCFVNGTTLGSTAVLGMTSIAATAQLYPDLGKGEYRNADRERFFSIIEFDAMGPDRTKVQAFDAGQGQLDDNWKRIEACAAK